MAYKPQPPSPLMQAVRAGSLTGVVHALEAGGDVNEPDIHGYPGLPLRAACFAGNIAVVSALIVRGAALDAPTDEGPGAPLRLAVRAGQHAIVSLLLEHGAKVPDGVKIDPALLPKDDNLIEFTPSDRSATTSQITRGFLLETEPPETASQPLPDSQLAISTGTETNLLTMDLLHFMEDGDHADLPERDRGVDFDLLLDPAALQTPSPGKK